MKLLDRFKLKKQTKFNQTTFCYCPNCKTELVNSNSFESECDGIITYKCSKCKEETKWYFDTPCPLLVK